MNAHTRGVEVVVIMDDEQSERAASLYKYLHDNGVLVALDTSSGLMHIKAIVIDGEKVWTGSTNPTENGVNTADTKNDENIIIVHDAGFTQEHRDEFNKWWSEWGT